MIVITLNVYPEKTIFTSEVFILLEEHGAFFCLKWTLTRLDKAMNVAVD